MAGGSAINPQLIALRRSRALLDKDDGRAPEALRELTDIIEVLTGSNDLNLQVELAGALRDRASVHEFSRRWQNALDDLDESTRITRSLPAFPRRTLLGGIADQRARLLSKPDTPIFDATGARESLATLRELGQQNWMLDTIEGELAAREGNWAASASSYRRSIEALERENWVDGVARARMCLARALLELDDIDAARAEIDRVLPHFEAQGPVDLFGEVLLERARVHLATQDYAAAWEGATRGLDNIEQTIRQFRAIFDQQRFISDKLDKYQLAFRIARGAGSVSADHRSWQIAERAKSFYLCNLVANADVKLFEGVDPELAESLQDAEAELDRIEATIGRHGASDEALTLLQTVTDRRNAIQAELMHANPRWATLRMPPQFEVETALAALPAGWVMASFFWQETDDATVLHLFYARPGQPIGHAASEWTPAELTALDAGRDAPLNAGSGGLWAIDELLDAQLVSKLLPGAFLDWLVDGDKLLVSPHGRLRMLPLHALRIDSDRRLIDRVTVQYVPTLSLLAMARDRRPAADVLVMGCEQDGFGDVPLPEVPGELAAISRIWQGADAGQVDTVAMDQARSFGDGAPAPSRWESYGVIHLACHGVFDAERPMDAALRLGTEAVRASEFFSVRLNARVVALSACDLGGTSVAHESLELHGDEWLGLLVPLMYAGARTTLVSLWYAMDEETAIMMTGFHRELVAGRSPAEAFRTSVRALQRQPLAHWSNWYLVGLPD